VRKKPGFFPDRFFFQQKKPGFLSSNEADGTHSNKITVFQNHFHFTNKPLRGKIKEAQR